MAIPRYTTIAVLVFFTQASIYITSCSGKCVESERDALLSFKQDITDPSNWLSSWSAARNNDCCESWAGIVCDNFTGHVKELRLGHTPAPTYYWEHKEMEAHKRSVLGGKISPSLLNLKQLSHLDLSNNDFGFIPIPSFIGSMVNLRYLNLSQARFLGMIPHQLGNLSHLRFLDLRSPYSNLLHVENLHWLYGLPSLVHLDLSYANLNKASDWLPIVNMLPNLLELHLYECELVVDDHIHSLLPYQVNFTSLSVLDMSRNNFGSLIIPKWVLSLGSLTSLRLAGNDFQGPIPSPIQNLTVLEHLDLSLNLFNSTVPNWLYKMTSLVVLDLSRNELEGEVPKFIGNLCNLKEISLVSNRFGGNVVEVFESLSGCLFFNLVSLDLGENRFSGHLTNQLGQFKNLISLSLPSNSISGPIPESIGRLSNLKLLDISDNQLNGSLPDGLWSLSKLETLYFSSNHLEGVLSEFHFANLTNLIALRASRNQLILQVSPSWVPPFRLHELELRLWHLGPEFPMWLRSQDYFTLMDLSCTGISDSVPTWFWNLTSRIVYLNLSHNQIHGQIPDVLKFAESFTMVYLYSNQFTGPLPGLSNRSSELDLSNNSFSGDLSHLLCDKIDEPPKPKILRILHLGGNLLSGEIPDCWRNLLSLELVILSNNNLTGQIPNSMFAGLPRLQSLHLRDNKLSGEIPVSLQNCTSLLTLDLSVNKFTGISIPKWMGSSFPRLKVLSFRSNEFNGEIPNELCMLTSLQILDLADNNFSGTLPRCLNNFQAMATRQNSSDHIFYSFWVGKYLENAFVWTKGREVQYNTILRLATSLDISSNNLSGEIPEQLTALLGLLSLNLSGNGLSGTIPQKIGDMESLESLDVSRNKLHGNIPPSMSSLSFLSHLNLSYNKLSGKIPSSTQIQSLDGSGFVGNDLCGPPLTQNCSKIVTEDTTETDDDDDDDQEVDWVFYVSVIIGFFVGFWGFCGPFLFNRSWRLVYFRFLDCVWHKLCSRVGCV